jgi:DNA-directed RNA polymerase subunit RPC12/RpoP
MQLNLKRYFWYLARWQASTPILAPVVAYFSFHFTRHGFSTTAASWTSAAIANLIGGLIFFWIDGLLIFNPRLLRAQWEVEEDVICSDCGRKSRGYRVVRTKNYDKSTDKTPKFRCERCSIAKADKLRSEGIEL